MKYPPGRAHYAPMRTLVGLVAVLVAACDQGAPPPAPVAPVAPVAPPAIPRPHTVKRSTAKLDDALPAHGLALHIYGIGGDDLTVVDTDAGTLRYVDHPMFQDRKPTDRTVKLTGDERALVITLADAAWREEPNGHTPNVTDVGSYLEIGDGDDVFVAKGTLFEGPWRPAAGMLMIALDGVLSR